MSAIIRGTTPEITVPVSTDVCALSDVSALELYVTNGATTTTYTEDDVTVDTSENTLMYTFTEAETTAFDAHFPVIVQARFWLSEDEIVGIDKIVYCVTDMDSI